MRRRVRNSRAARRNKYSQECRMVNTDVIDNWTSVSQTASMAAHRETANVIVPATDVQGTRKVKYFDLTFCAAGSDTPVASGGFTYALVFVPEGYEYNHISIPLTGASSSIYEPSQYVISQGVLDFSGGPLHFRSPLSRNLNSGDRIVLVLSSVMGSRDVYLQAAVKYAITMN